MPGDPRDRYSRPKDPPLGEFKDDEKTPVTSEALVMLDRRQREQSRQIDLITFEMQSVKGQQAQQALELVKLGANMAIVDSKVGSVNDKLDTLVEASETDRRTREDRAEAARLARLEREERKQAREEAEALRDERNEREDRKERRARRQMLVTIIMATLAAVTGGIGTIYGVTRSAPSASAPASAPMLPPSSGSAH